MFKKLFKGMLGFSSKGLHCQKTSDQSQEIRPLSSNIQTNLQALRQVFDLCIDVVFREFMVDAEQPIKAFVVFIGPLTDLEMISEQLIRPLTQQTSGLPPGVKLSITNAIQVLQDYVLNVAETNTIGDQTELVNKVLEGNTALVLDGSTSAIITGLRGGAVRNVDEPDTEPVVRGPKDGFVESVDTNISLLRRRLKTSRLKVEAFKVGALTKTNVVVCYVKGIANDKVVNEVKQRISRVNMDSVLGSNYIEEMISDEAITLFPLIQYTERPDKTAASLVEGRVAVMTDNSPMVLLAPATFVTLLQATEDYYNNAFFATMIRLLRFIALNIALVLPAVIVALFSFHQTMVPTSLLTTAAAAREGLPFPIFVEVMLMELTFELLREAGVRMPKAIGQTVSTVGGLVIGQAAVTAGIVSPISVIVVALTAIANFAIPNYAAGTAIRILRFALIILAGFLGALGIMMGLMATLVHLCSLRSFGVPYLSPIAPLSTKDLKDTMIRAPWWSMQTRPRLFGAKEPVRQDPDQGPSKPDSGGGG
ncbi:MAG: spore germination protein [Bacillota bacterium]|nr:spore germination protein [Bacillota bacterium]